MPLFKITYKEKISTTYKQDVLNLKMWINTINIPTIYKYDVVNLKILKGEFETSRNNKNIANYFCNKYTTRV